jgi:2-oxoglutarate dehydrogenase E1 component
MHRSRGAVNLLWQRCVASSNPLGAVASTRPPTSAMMYSASSPPPPTAVTAAKQESFMNGNNSAYVDEMYECWGRDPTSVHASWDAYFRGIHYTPPPSLGNTRANEIPLSAIMPALAGAGGAMAGSGVAPSSHVIEAHLSVQATIRSYQVKKHNWWLQEKL